MGESKGEGAASLTAQQLQFAMNTAKGASPGPAVQVSFPTPDVLLKDILGRDLTLLSLLQKTTEYRKRTSQHYHV